MTRSFEERVPAAPTGTQARGAHLGTSSCSRTPARARAPGGGGGPTPTSERRAWGGPEPGTPLWDPPPPAGLSSPLRRSDLSPLGLEAVGELRAGERLPRALGAQIWAQMESPWEAGPALSGHGDGAGRWARGRRWYFIPSVAIDCSPWSRGKAPSPPPLPRPRARARRRLQTQAPGTMGASEPLRWRNDTLMIDFPLLFLAPARLHSRSAFTRERHSARMRHRERAQAPAAEDSHRARGAPCPGPVARRRRERTWGGGVQTRAPTATRCVPRSLSFSGHITVVGGGPARGQRCPP